MPPCHKKPAVLNTYSDWFIYNKRTEESLVKGDRFRSHGDRIITFSTDEMLKFLSRDRTIAADGTFKITPYGWYQIFIVSAEAKENLFVPVAFVLLLDKAKDS